MIWSIISENDILASQNSVVSDNSIRSSNPYDYLRMGYYLDNASMYGGKNFVNYNSNISGDRTSPELHIPAV